MIVFKYYYCAPNILNLFLRVLECFSILSTTEDGCPNIGHTTIDNKTQKIIINFNILVKCIFPGYIFISI